MTNKHTNNNSNEQLAAFLTNNLGILKFYFYALIIFAVFFLIYSNFIVETAIFEQYLELYTSLASEFLNRFVGEESFINRSTLLIDTELRVKDGAFIVVSEGCDASTVFATLFATVLAWPSPIWKRIVVAAIGTLIMFGFNILRIAGMLLTDIHFPLYFDFVHVWILPQLLIVAALIYFYVWTKLSGRHPDEWS